MSGLGGRLFFALLPDDGVRDALVDWQRRVVPETGRATHRLDLHLTLHFLGHVPDERAAALHRIGDELAPAAFEVVLDRVGRFPGARALWAGGSTSIPPLLRLHEQLGSRLQRQGFELDAREYRPHVTLARKVSQCPDYDGLAPIHWQVCRWALFESCPGRMPLYRPLAVWEMPPN